MKPVAKEHECDYPCADEVRPLILDRKTLSGVCHFGRRDDQADCHNSQLGESNQSNTDATQRLYEFSEIRVHLYTPGEFER